MNKKFFEEKERMMDNRFTATALINQNQNKKLTLRKEQIANRIMFKRQFKEGRDDEKNEPFAIKEDDYFVTNDILERKVNNYEERFDFLLTLLSSKDINKVKYSISTIRHELNNEQDIEFERLYNIGFVNLLLEVLDDYRKDKKIIYEALYILTNFTYKIETDDLSALLITPKCYRLYEYIFEYKIPQLSCLIIWLITNFSFEKQNIVDNLNSSNLVLNKILPFIENIENYKLTIYEKDYNELISKGVCLICYLVSTCKISLNYEPFRKRCVNIIIKYTNTNNIEIFSCITSALAKLSQERGRFSSDIINCGIIEMILNNKMTDQQHIRLFGSRLLGNFSTEISEEYAVQIMERLFSFAKRCLEDDLNLTRMQSAWLLANFIVTSPRTFNYAINDLDLLKKLKHLLQEEREYCVLRELFFLLGSLISSAELNDFFKLMSFSYIELLVKHIDKHIKDEYILSIILEIIIISLKTGESVKNQFHYNVITDILVKSEGVDLIEKLQNSNFPTIAKMASEIVNDYFNGNMQNSSYQKTFHAKNNL